MSIFHLLKRNTDLINAENNDVAYDSKGSFNLNFSSLVGSLRYNKKNALELFKNAFNGDIKASLKILCYLRDIRGGLGERTTFRSIFRYLCLKESELSSKLIRYK